VRHANQKAVRSGKSENAFFAKNVSDVEGRSSLLQAKRGAFQW